VQTPILVHLLAFIADRSAPVLLLRCTENRDLWRHVIVGFQRRSRDVVDCRDVIYRCCRPDLLSSSSLVTSCRLHVIAVVSS